MQSRQPNLKTLMPDCSISLGARLSVRPNAHRYTLAGFQRTRIAFARLTHFVMQHVSTSQKYATSQTAWLTQLVN